MARDPVLHPATPVSWCWPEAAASVPPPATRPLTREGPAGYPGPRSYRSAGDGPRTRPARPRRWPGRSAVLSLLPAWARAAAALPAQRSSNRVLVSFRIGKTTFNHFVNTNGCQIIHSDGIFPCLQQLVDFAGAFVRVSRAELPRAGRRGAWPSVCPSWLPVPWLRFQNVHVCLIIFSFPVFINQFKPLLSHASSTN